MMGKRFYSLLFLFCVVFEIVGSSSLSVTRSIDISTQVARHVLNIEFKSDGSDLNSFLHVLTKEQDDHLAYIVASDSSSKKLTVNRVQTPQNGNKDYVYYKVDFATPATKGTAYKIRIEYVLTQILKAYPAEITQAETQ